MQGGLAREQGDVPVSRPDQEKIHKTVPHGSPAACCAGHDHSLTPLQKIGYG